MQRIKRLAYRFSQLAKLQEYAQAQKLYSQAKYEEASEYYSRCLDILQKAPKNEDLLKLFERAMDNELAVQNYKLAASYCNRLLTNFPEKRDNFYITQHIANILANPEKQTSPASSDPILKAIDNILVGKPTPIINPTDLKKGLLETSSRSATIVALSNYLTISNSIPQDSPTPNPSPFSPALTPLTTHLNHTFSTKLTPTQLTPQQRLLLPGVATLPYHKLLYAFSFILFNSQSYSNNVLSSWLNLFLKATQINPREYLYRPLCLLAAFYQANNKSMVAEAMLNSAFDVIDRRRKPEEYRMLRLSLAGVFEGIERRQAEAKKIREENLPTYNFRKVLLQMIL